MKEKLKTILLATLVLLSLLQSYMLGFNRPHILPTNPAEYVETDLRGEQMDVDDLIFPRDMVIHFGDEKHTFLYPNDMFYTMILERLQAKQLYSLRDVQLDPVEMERMRQEMAGIEIRFQTAIPYHAIKHKLNATSDILPDSVRILSFWLVGVPAEEKVNLLLLTDQGAYQANRVDLSLKELDQLIQFGEHLYPLFQLVDGRLYIPEKSLKVAPKVRLSYELYTSEQLRNSLFVDPGISRSMMQLDGTEMITDGKRGLQINHKKNWINYSDPVAPMDSGNEFEIQLSSAVQFINQHGGWNGKYMVSRLPSNYIQQFRFIQVYESLPIIPTEESQYGYVQVTMRQRTATGYERSLINIDVSTAEKTSYELYGGAELEAQIEALGRERIVSVFPAYEPIITDEAVELIPRWAVEFISGRYEIIP